MMNSMSLTCVSLVVVVMMTTTSNVVVAETIIDAGYNALYGDQGKLIYVFDDILLRRTFEQTV